MPARRLPLSIGLVLVSACHPEPDELGETRHYVISDDNFAEGGCTYPGSENRLWLQVRASYEEYACTRSVEHRNLFDDDCETYGWAPRLTEVPFRVEQVTCTTAACAARVDERGDVVVVGSEVGDVWVEILVSLPGRDARPKIVRGHYWNLASIDEGCGLPEQHRH